MMVNSLNSLGFEDTPSVHIVYSWLFPEELVLVDLEIHVMPWIEPSKPPAGKMPYPLYYLSRTDMLFGGQRHNIVDKDLSLHIIGPDSVLGLYIYMRYFGRYPSDQRDRINPEPGRCALSSKIYIHQIKGQQVL